MHWKDGLLLTWGVTSAIMFNVQLAGHVFWKLNVEWKKDRLCPECRRRLDRHGQDGP